MNKRKIIPKNVGMYVEQWSVVEFVADQYGFNGNVSVALRYIVNEYWRSLQVNAKPENMEKHTHG